MSNNVFAPSCQDNWLMSILSLFITAERISRVESEQLLLTVSMVTHAYWGVYKLKWDYFATMIKTTKRKKHQQP